MAAKGAGASTGRSHLQPDARAPVGLRDQAAEGGHWREIFNSDSTYYGGSGQGNSGRVPAADKDGGHVAKIHLPPLSTLMLTPETEAGDGD